MSQKLLELELKLKKVWMKMLKAYAKGKIEKGYKLEDKAIQLELKIKDQEKTLK